MPRVFWKCLFSVSSKPYANPWIPTGQLQTRELSEGGIQPTQRKKSNVTMVSGHKLWRKVRLAALVTLLLSTRMPERFLNILLMLTAMMTIGRSLFPPLTEEW